MGMGKPQLMVLSEQTPVLMLHDVLQGCEHLRIGLRLISFFPYQSEGGLGLIIRMYV
jgi:hypothetical protein